MTWCFLLPRLNRDFANSRDRLRRLDSVDSHARLTLVQHAPVESTLKQELARVRAAAEARGLESTRERGTSAGSDPIADRLMLTPPVVHG